MKSFLLICMLCLFLVGCKTYTPEQQKEMQDLTSRMAVAEGRARILAKGIEALALKAIEAAKDVKADGSLSDAAKKVMAEIKSEKDTMASAAGALKSDVEYMHTAYKKLESEGISGWQTLGNLLLPKLGSLGDLIGWGIAAAGGGGYLMQRRKTAKVNNEKEDYKVAAGLMSRGMRDFERDPDTAGKPASFIKATNGQENLLRRIKREADGGLA